MDLADKLCMIEPGKHKQIEPQCACGRGKPIGRLIKDYQNDPYIKNVSLIVCHYCKTNFESRYNRFECLST